MIRPQREVEDHAAEHGDHHLDDLRGHAREVEDGQRLAGDRNSQDATNQARQLVAHQEPGEHDQCPDRLGIVAAVGAMNVDQAPVLFPLREMPDVSLLELAVAGYLTYGPLSLVIFLMLVAFSWIYMRQTRATEAAT